MTWNSARVQQDRFLTFSQMSTRESRLRWQGTSLRGAIEMDRPSGTLRWPWMNPGSTTAHQRARSSPSRGCQLELLLLGRQRLLQVWKSQCLWSSLSKRESSTMHLSVARPSTVSCTLRSGQSLSSICRGRAREGHSRVVSSSRHCLPSRHQGHKRLYGQEQHQPYSPCSLQPRPCPGRLLALPCHKEAVGRHIFQHTARARDWFGGVLPRALQRCPSRCVWEVAEKSY